MFDYAQNRRGCGLAVFVNMVVVLVLVPLTVAVVVIVVDLGREVALGAVVPA